MVETTSNPTGMKPDGARQQVLLAAGAVLAVLLLATYAHTLYLLGRQWVERPDDYAHGFFVLPFAVVLLWTRREMATPWPDRGSLWSIPFFVLWALIRWYGAYAKFAVDAYSILPCLAGMALLLGGWRALRWAWPAILFLVFMIPLPGRLEGELSGPLQNVGARVSVFVIQSLGIPATVQGNIITMAGGRPLEVERACSGLRMLMLFFAICVGAAMVIRVALWERLVIIVSAVPIAIFSNVVRITVTALLHHLGWGDLAEKVFHDMAGLLMSPIAILVLWAEISLLRRLFIETETESPLAFDAVVPGGSSRGAASTGAAYDTPSRRAP